MALVASQRKPLECDLTRQTSAHIGMTEQSDDALARKAYVGYKLTHVSR